MPRTQRIAGSTGIYPVLLRGINRQLIFEEDKDRYARLMKLIVNKAASMREACGASNAPAFQALGKDAQRRATGMLTEKQVPMRQPARISGLSKGVAERWARKGKRDK